jgi:hypothetical protein
VDSLFLPFRRADGEPDSRTSAPLQASLLSHLAPYTALPPIRLLLRQVGPPPVAGKNGLGLGPNATGLALGVIFFGVYYGSAYLTKKWIMKSVDDPVPPKYFREIQLKTSDDAPPRS